jgi:transposase-like protein
MGSYTTETKAQALALVMAGTPAEVAARELRINPRAVQRWAAKCREMSPEQWQPVNDRIIERASELVMDALDQMEDEGDILKHLNTLNALRGTSIDKALAIERKNGYTGDAPLVIAVFPSMPENVTTIDVSSEIVEHPDD